MDILFSHKRQMENKETQLTTGIKDLSLMINKPYIAYVFKKTQKISQALYLITGRMDSAEQLHMTIRVNANLVLTHATNLLRNDQKDKINCAHDLIASYLHTLALLETAYLVQVLSDSNYVIIKDEINKLLEVIETNKEKGVKLGREFIETPSLDEYKRQAILYKGQNESHSSVLYVKDTIKDNKHPESKPYVSRNSKVVNQESKSLRLNKITALFKPGIELMIKDITLHLKDVSEKTIQRELLLLVAKGVLKKKGERRWSRYILKQ